MKVLPFKRKDENLSSVDKSLNLADVCHQKLEQLEKVLNTEGSVPDSENCAVELKRISHSLDLVLKRVTIKPEYKKVV